MVIASLLLVVLASLIHATKRAASVGPIFVFAYNLIACTAYAPWVFYLLMHGDGIAWSLTSGYLLTGGHRTIGGCGYLASLELTSSQIVRPDRCPTLPCTDVGQPTASGLAFWN